MKNLFLRLLRAAGVKLGLIEPDILYYIGGSDVLPSPLPPDEEARCIRLLGEGDTEARAKLIEHNLRLVVYISKKFDKSGADIEDFISVGTIGLIKAVNSFKSDKNIKLATYASRCIENEILMYLRRTVKLRNEVSFEEPLNTDWEGNELLLSDILGTENDTVYRDIETCVERELLMLTLKKLGNREQEIMHLRFGLGGTSEKTQKEVADMLGISQSYISRLEKKIIGRLKKELIKLS